MKNKNNIRELLANVVDPTTAPDHLCIEFNGTSTSLNRIRREDGTVFWVGTPKDRQGRSCRYSLTVECSGFVGGSAALNFITNGGWDMTTKVDAFTKSQLITEFRKTFLFLCVEFAGACLPKNVISDIERLSGLTALPGKIQQEELPLLALMQVPYDAIRIAQSNGIRFNIDIPLYVSRFVRSTYAECVPGPWDDESDDVALTSSLQQAMVSLMQMSGLKFRRVARRTSAA